jgi:hypothetical protein
MSDSIDNANMAVEQAFNDLLRESAGDSAGLQDLLDRNMAIEQRFNELRRAIEG